MTQQTPFMQIAICSLLQFILSEIQDLVVRSEGTDGKQFSTQPRSFPEGRGVKGMVLVMVLLGFVSKNEH